MKAKICINCGAPLHTNKCEYCDTEYEVDIDNNICHKGRQINEQILEIEINGGLHRFYISDIETNVIYSKERRLRNGYLAKNILAEKRRIELIEV